MSVKKSKVLSVRLSLADLQSCFDLCSLAGYTPSGASSAIAGSLKLLMHIQRERGILPVYTESELCTMLDRFMGKINPSTFASLEESSKVDLSCNLFLPIPSVPAQSLHSQSGSVARQRDGLDKRDGLENFEEQSIDEEVEKSYALQQDIVEEQFVEERNSFALSQEFARELSEAIAEIEMEDEISLLSKILL
jgi:hypothetical protein